MQEITALELKNQLDAGADIQLIDDRHPAEYAFASIAGAKLIPLGEITQKSGKRVQAWAVEGSSVGDVDAVESNFFEMEWPPKSGKRERFPEVDRAMWADPATARVKLNPHQVPFVDRLLDALGVDEPG